VREASAEDLATIWSRVRGELEASLPPSTFKLWLEPLRLLRAQDSVLYLSAPDGVREWVERRYLPRLLLAIRRQTPSLSEIILVPSDECPVGEGKPDAQAASEPGLDGQAAFQSFVIGRANRFAHAAALAVAELPGEAYNPLFLYGAPGLGKTHLLRAIATYLRERHPGLGVRYTTAESFTAEFVAALRTRGAESFKRRFRDLDALLIDDVQFLENKPQTEEEFFHTFNALYESGSQIVLSSDRPPQALSRLAERLRDRFEWGLCAELGEPDLRTRVAVLTRLATRAAPDLPAGEAAAVLREIAARAPANLRRLEGALTRVIAFASMMGKPATPELVRQLLDSAPDRTGADESAPRRGGVEDVQEAVCAVLHLSRDDLLSTRRSPPIVRGRQLAIYIARLRLSLSLNDLAQSFRRDRATILHSVRAIERDLGPQTQTTAALAEIHRHLDAVGAPDRRTVP
jgi:chromosomal replication initiator protein